jgi:hypothetical protein
VSLLTEWFAQALELPEGDRLFIVVQDRPEQTRVRRGLNELKEAYKEINPVDASKILITKDHMNLQLYVRIDKSKKSMAKGFIKDVNGVIREISLDDDPDRDRRIMLIVRDGYNQDEVEEFMGGLTDNERKKYFG